MTTVNFIKLINIEIYRFLPVYTPARVEIYIDYIDARFTVAVLSDAEKPAEKPGGKSGRGENNDERNAANKENRKAGLVTRESSGIQKRTPGG